MYIHVEIIENMILVYFRNLAIMKRIISLPQITSKLNHMIWPDQTIEQITADKLCS